MGQGDIVKLKISEDNPDNTKGGKNPERAQSESGDAEDNLKSPSAISLNAKNRKHRKFTSGDNYEPFDELENIGFTEEPDSSLLFETNGYFIGLKFTLEYRRNTQLFHEVGPKCTVSLLTFLNYFCKITKLY